MNSPVNTDGASLDAVILVGGKGTRLQSVVRDRPKPMADVAGRPFVEWLLLDLRLQGIRRAILSTGYMGRAVESYFGDGTDWDMELVYSPEPTPLGTAGALRHALKHVRTEAFFAMNGDSYCPVDLKAMAEVHSKHGAMATMWLVPMPDCSRYGSVVVGGNGVVHEFEEKPRGRGPGLVNAGMYLLDRDLVATIPAGQQISLERDFFPGLVGRGLYALIGDGPLTDIGTPESYREAQRLFRCG
ncbi:MAG: nucleotidyltransferase family protein, partial [Chloroflexota bacterium]